MTKLGKNGFDERKNEGCDMHDRSADSSTPDTDRIARHLKEVYDETANEPLPEKLKKLLEQLGARE